MSARVLVVVFSDGGHLNPMLSVMQRLEDAGHDLVVFSLQDDVTERCARAGLRARCATAALAAVPAGKVEAQRSVAIAKRLANPAWAKRWMSAVLIDPLRAQVAALRAEIAANRPHVIVSDAMAYAGAIAAELEGVAWATVATTLLGFASDVATFPPDLAAKRDAAVAATGVRLTFRASDVVSPHLDIVLAYARLLGDLAPAATYAVGPALPLARRGDERPFPFDALPTDVPIVYVAFGSHLSHGPDVYTAVTSALGPDEAFFVVVLKDLLEEPFAKALPPHVLTVEYAPQLDLLARASVMVNHGGANSVLEALSRGCPMVVLPITYDQPLLARLVEQAGVGVGLTAAGLTVEAARTALLPLLAPDAPARQAARQLATEGGDGAARTAELITALAMSGSGITRRG
ncbi:MAG TPA: glycosyltransferase [Kofleriaceae bacterium]|jgi:UDP:flavonoid glycosyltransferase YjiC (YdhE family)